LGRRFGQHFLSKKSILDRIAAAACGERASLSVEIGPGKGALTACLLERTEKLVAIEVDPYLIQYLRQKFAEPMEQGRLELIEGDVLKTDLGAWGPAVFAGNLPYYITSPILEKIFELSDAWTRAVFLVQAEVAARLAASPGNRDFGYLSVETQLYSKPEILFSVARTAFHPPPKVDSAVVQMEPRPDEFGDREGILRFAASCFRHKRKTLRNNLAPLYGKDRVDALPETKRRAEQLTVAELAELYRKLS
jgi:16S rRNA (adenine1518-N6/adenine1519-N6)-dimethyltransferase